MKPIIVSSSTVRKQSFGPILVQELLSLQDSPDMSTALITLEGTNTNAKNIVSDTFYFVLEGEGVFTVEGSEYPVKKGDVIMIPKNTFYFDSGKMTLLSYCTPRFDSANIVTAE